MKICHAVTGEDLQESLITRTEETCHMQGG